MEQLRHFRFLFDSPVPPGYSRIHSTETLPFSFKTLLASVDVILTKPGYGTIVEAVALQQPVVYVRRYNFADEQPLVDYLHRYGRGVEMSMKEFKAGRWEAAIRKADETTVASAVPPPPTGAAQAAAVLAPYLLDSRD
jgi:UDP-N-acetylglucosamine:LPS N-acetylglucosamine transferase